MKSKIFNLTKQFIFRLILTWLGQYAIIVGIKSIDPTNSITEIVSLLPLTAMFSSLINTALFGFIVFAINKVSSMREKIMITIALISGLFLHSIVLFVALEGIFGVIFAYLFLFILPFLLIETILYFIRNRKIL